MVKNKIFALAILIIAIIAVILVINYVTTNENSDEETMRCIASKSELYVTRTCHVCATQKEVLSGYLDLFDMTDCIEYPEKCIEAGIVENGMISIPAWIINGKKYPGFKNIKELKELAGC